MGLTLQKTGTAAFLSDARVCFGRQSAVGSCHSPPSASDPFEGRWGRVRPCRSSGPNLSASPTVRGIVGRLLAVVIEGDELRRPALRFALQDGVPRVRSSGLDSVGVGSIVLVRRKAQLPGHTITRPSSSLTSRGRWV